MSRLLRITGLVRTADVVRRELSQPVTAQNRQRLRDRVAANLRQVQQILKQSNARLEHLPAPSQRAYRFLASLDWEKLPAAVSGEESAAPAAPISWRGLSGFVDRTLDRLAVELEAAEIEQIRESIARTSRQIEGTIQRQNLSPDRLTPATRELRGWLALFSRGDDLQSYVQSRKTAAEILNAAAIGSRRFPPPLRVQFRPMRGIYRLRVTRGTSVLWAPTPMIAFDADGFRALSELVFSRNREARRLVIATMTGEGYQGVRAELELLGGIVEQSSGVVHDLAAAFDRVNAAYFGGGMPRPRLTWNRTFTGRKFGHYDWILDTVMVSRTLDAPGVPAFVVDFLVFHELLHKFHGLHWVNGRGYAHTAEFYESERKFARYAEAEEILGKLTMEVRRR